MTKGVLIQNLKIDMKKALICLGIIAMLFTFLYCMDTLFGMPPGLREACFFWIGVLMMGIWRELGSSRPASKVSGGTDGIHTEGELKTFRQCLQGQIEAAKKQGMDVEVYGLHWVEQAAELYANQFKKDSHAG